MKVERGTQRTPASATCAPRQATIETTGDHIDQSEGAVAARQSIVPATKHAHSGARVKSSTPLRAEGGGGSAVLWFLGNHTLQTVAGRLVTFRRGLQL
mgnify:CR=1 FL=1